MLYLLTELIPVAVFLLLVDNLLDALILDVLLVLVSRYSCPFIEDHVLGSYWQEAFCSLTEVPVWSCTIP